MEREEILPGVGLGREGGERKEGAVEQEADRLAIHSGSTFG